MSRGLAPTATYRLRRAEWLAELAAKAPRCWCGSQVRRNGFRGGTQLWKCRRGHEIKGDRNE